jgi:hypothetical protein
MRERGSGRGWWDFAAALFAIAGIFNAIAGLGAIFKKEHFQGAPLLYDNLQLWGWVWLVIGVLQVAIAAALLDGRARMAAIVVAALSAVAWFASLDAAPAWGILVVALDVLAIYGLAIHGDVPSPAAPDAPPVEYERQAPPPPR